MVQVHKTRVQLQMYSETESVFISLHGGTSPLQNIIRRFYQSVADIQKWFNIAEENCFQKPINSSDFKQLLTLCLTLRHNLTHQMLVALSECHFIKE